MPQNSFFDNIQKQLNKQLPFVCYRLPNQSEVKAIFQNTADLWQTSNFTESGFVFAPYNIHKQAVLIPNSQSQRFSFDYQKSDTATSTKTTPQTNIGKEKHLNLVKKAINTINTSTLKKVVVSRTETIDSNNFNCIDCFKSLLNTYQNAFAYCWYHPKVGLWLGATPEILLQLKGNRFTTMALAGTKTNANSQWGKKEIEEQQFVTDYIQTQLQPISNFINTSPPETTNAGALQHLKTTINGILKTGYKLSHILSKIHPTPAVCGLPLAEATQFIVDNEGYDREFYTGFLGEINAESKTENRAKRNIENRAYNINQSASELFVNLRCMQIINNKAKLYIGGGITKDSNPNLEWQETIEKSMVMKNILNKL